MLEAISTIFLTFLNLSLGLLVFSRNPKHVINRSFFIFAVTISFFLLTNYLADATFARSSALLWNKLFFANASFMIPSLVYFSFNFPIRTTLNKKIIYLLFGTGFLWAGLSFTNLIVERVDLFDWGSNVVQGPLFIPLCIYAVFLLLVFFFLITRNFIKSRGVSRSQLLFFLLGFTIFWIMVLFSNVFLTFVTGTTRFSKFGNYSTVPLLGFTAYAIVKHRLMDIRLVVARAVAYTLLVGVIGAFYTIVSFLATSFLFKTTTNFQQIALYATLTIIIAFTFQPLRRFLEERTDKIFYKGHYDSQALLSQLSTILATTLGIKDLSSGTISLLVEEMRVSRGAILVTKGATIEHQETYGYTKEPKFHAHELLDLKDGQIIVFDELEEGHTKKLLRDMNITIVVPLKVGEDTLGYLLLGEKSSGEIYTNQDIDVLEVFSPELSIAIENAKSYEEIKGFNIKLAAEVKKATANLVAANEKLKELDEAKDEFVSVASHELRTPMTAIKSYVWLALHNKAGDLNDKLRDYLDKVYTSSERMIALIGDMLNVSRIETGRIEMEIGVVSPYKVIDMVLSDLSAKAGELGVSLSAEKENIVPLVKADRNKLAEILMNLAGNSLKFTPKGGKVTITAKKNDSTVEVSVADTGVGISKENMTRLFAKFGRIESSYATAGQAASTGTGLGLWISKNYIEKMGGKIWVNSALGKGTTFTFSLPIAAGAKEETEIEEEAFVPRKVIT